MFKPGVNWIWATTVLQSTVSLENGLAGPPELEPQKLHFQSDAFRAKLLEDVQCPMKTYAAFYNLANVQVDSLEIEIWTEGKFASYATNLSEHSAVVYLSHSCSTDAASGSLLLHDPRVGADNIFIPNLPVGRVIKTMPIIGNCVIFPRPLRYSISCVRQRDWLIVAKLSLTGLI